MTALGRDLTDDQAELPVPACPQWTVRQVFAHQAGVAADILGGRLDGVTTDAWTDRQVAERADRSLTEILDEWDGDAPRVLEAMAPMADAVDPRMVIDIWTHDQDVRSAVDRPGHRDDATATWVAERLQANAERRFIGADLSPTAVAFGSDPVDVAVVADPFEFSRAAVGRRSPAQVSGWAWSVEDPDPYVALIPVFTARSTDLIEPA